MTIHNSEEEIISDEDFVHNSENQETENHAIDIPDKEAIIQPIGKGNKSLTRYFQSPGHFFLGVFYAFMSGFIFTLNNWAIQSQRLDFSETIIVRGVAQIGIIGCINFYKGNHLWPSVGDKPNKLRALMLMQGLFAGIMVICTYCCLLFLPLGDALTLIFSAPLATMTMAAIFLGQSLRLYKISFGLVLLSGTVLVVRPPFLFPVVS